jgi:hypothetical protein
MSRDTILKAPDGTRYSFDNLASQKWLDGHVPGAECVAGWLSELGVTAWRNGDDKRALLLRELAAKVRSEIVPELQRAAAAHEKDHPYEIPRRTEK